MKRTNNPVLRAVTSLKLTIACLAALMVLVLACTLAQVKLGTWPAVEIYMRPWFVWWDVPRTGWRVPVFPGGALVGLVLIVNLLAAQLSRLELSWKKAGLWISHAGLVLLVAGEFVSGAMQVESQLAVEEGQTVNYVESPRELELAVIDVTDRAVDDVYSVPARRLERGGAIAIPNTPLTIQVRRWFANSELAPRGPADPASPVTAGFGTGVTVRERPPVSRDDMVNQAAAFVEPVAGGRSYGTWLVANGLRAVQTFVHEGRTYQLQLRSRREYLPFAVTLKDFRHDVYPGTQIPKNFSSLVHIANPARGESRDVLIYMNQPLRYEGKAFYQASFGKGDTLSILQVVENPGWLLPYVSCVLVAIGLVVHFAITLRRSSKRRQAALEA
ncbi:cytochrome c biogenesis protein ResB [Anaeromyxobacter sp. Fw109-5]|uniref:cytochrome c biogenesis protein ResB n=1 Tax=Anaeromyxobacter sp. (strain Fw109-5) TaxID=404589 RepID=UPI0000ED7620|nr:cytochrome c biogenesis protein ResB [Anaeromyxobacter sp. Fw109-5]ABS25916.1 conserved hypothetical protein [Anaeromyxobacter sp. Fw109-5]